MDPVLPRGAVGKEAAKPLELVFLDHRSSDSARSANEGSVMKINVITVDLEIPRRTKRIALLLGIPALIIGGSAIAIAAVPNTFADGDVLSAEKMNANFTALDTRITALEQAKPPAPVIQVGNKQYSLDGVYCGSTAPVGGSIGGYTGAKVLCEQACGSSSSAHVCTPTEMVRTAQLAVPITNAGRIASGLHVLYPPNNYAINDCNGFTTGGASFYGAAWEPVEGVATVYACNLSKPLLCCDSP